MSQRAKDLHVRGDYLTHTLDSIFRGIERCSVLIQATSSEGIRDLLGRGEKKAKRRNGTSPGDGSQSNLSTQVGGNAWIHVK